MTTYLGDKAVGIGTVKAEIGVTGIVLHDETLVGNGNTEPLGVDKQVIATTNQVGNLATTLHAAIEAQAEAIAKTRENSVKKSGDTMTGDLVLDVVNNADIIFQDSTVDTAGNTNSYRKFISAPHQTQGFIFSEIKNGVNKMQFSMVNDGLIMPVGNRLLGSAKYPWDNIYAKKLNNGADVTIPTEGGTLARVEDLSEKIDKNQGTINAGKYLMVGDDGIVGLTESGGGGGIADVIHDSTLTGKGTKDEPLGVAKNLEVEELTVGTDEGTLNLSITAGVATIATNNGLDIVSPTKFDKAPTTDDNTTWADASEVSLVRKAQVATAITDVKDDINNLQTEVNTRTRVIIRRWN